MALITPKSQQWFDLRDKTRGVVVGVHGFKLVSASDTFRIPTLAEPASSTASVKQLERSGDPTVTVTASDADSDGVFRTVTLAGAVGDDVLIVSVHQGAQNFNEDEDV